MKDIPGYEGLYSVTKDGRVWSYGKDSKYMPNHNGKWLSLTIDRGYAYVGLYKNKRSKKIGVHRLVCLTYLEIDKHRLHVNHKNGKPSDNRLENLEWCTPKENCIHAWETGLSSTNDNVRELSSKKMHKWANSDKGKKFMSDNGRARRKLTKKEVLEIIQKSDKGQSAYSMVKEYPVSKPTILKIIRRETYKEFTQ